MPETPVRTLFGPWQVTKQIGEGGGGTVYRVVNTSIWNPLTLAKELVQSIRSVTGSIHLNQQDSVAQGIRIVSLLRKSLKAPRKAVGALKVSKLTNNADAGVRFKREIETLLSVQHEGVVRIIDHDKESFQWFVMEYFPEGSLQKAKKRFEGEDYTSLLRIKRIAEALGHLHESGVFHRDIKPSNIFLKHGRFMLGDLGVALPDDDGATRLTGSGQFILSRDWAPPWVRNREKHKFGPVEDVFMLGKVLYSIVSRNSNVEPGQLDDPDFDLRNMFPDKPEMGALQSLLRKVIVSRPEHCLQTMASFVDAINRCVDERYYFKWPNAEFGRELGEVKVRRCEVLRERNGEVCTVRFVIRNEEQAPVALRVEIKQFVVALDSEKADFEVEHKPLEVVVKAGEDLEVRSEFEVRGKRVATRKAVVTIRDEKGKRTKTFSVVGD